VPEHRVVGVDLRWDLPPSTGSTEPGTRTWERSHGRDKLGGLHRGRESIARKSQSKTLPVLTSGSVCWVCEYPAMPMRELLTFHAAGGLCCHQTRSQRAVGLRYSAFIGRKVLTVQTWAVFQRTAEFMWSSASKTTINIASNVVDGGPRSDDRVWSFRYRRPELKRS